MMPDLLAQISTASANFRDGAIGGARAGTGHIRPANVLSAAPARNLDWQPLLIGLFNGSTCLVLIPLVDGVPITASVGLF